nr:hypothetical protein [Methylobacterium sp. L1A1]
MDQRTQEQHGTLGTDRGRTEAYDAAATAREHVTEASAVADHGSATSDQPDGDTAYFDTTGANRGGEGDPAAADDANAADAPAGNDGGLFFPEVLAGLKGAEATAFEAKRQALGRAYEDLRIRGVASLDMMLAHAQLAAAALKWEPENLAAIAEHLGQADIHLTQAQNAVLARMQLVDAANAHAP